MGNFDIVFNYILNGKIVNVERFGANRRGLYTQKDIDGIVGLSLGFEYFRLFFKRFSAIKEGLIVVDLVGLRR